MQKEGGGGGGQQSHQYGETEQLVVEAASPISSRPPAAGGGGNLDDFMRLANVGGGEGASGNRWPRQETLALLKIRSDMDDTFRDATVKGPLWEDVSRKLAELGYKRSAKKCREKFENVHKYYKRTKETRAGRQDGKTYKFFSELEAFHSTSANVSIPTATRTTTANIPMASSLLPMPGSAPAPVPVPEPPIATTAAPFGISFSSNSSTFSQGFDEEDEVGLVQEPSSMAGTSHKRKRSSSLGGGSVTKKMMEFFEGLMKQVLQKQESMQQRFLEAVEKREQDRTIREEAWKRQESARLTREHELMVQERAIAASRDAAIISFLQKITGQTIQLHNPTVIIPPAAPPPPPPSQPTVSVVQATAHITKAPPFQTPPPSSQPPQQQQQQKLSHVTHLQHQQHPISSEIVMATPERQVTPADFGSSGSMMPESASSRWPKTEILALINLRSGLESRYQEAGPKGPLWEEISAGMLRMGYKRNPKRCKEKWENINKYFKKVKENNKQRPEDAKTCPYFHQLDALYRNKILGGATSSGSFSNHNRPQEETARPPSTAAPQQSEHQTRATANVVTSKEGNDGATKKPEDIVRDMEEQQHQGQSLLVDGYDKMDEPDSDNMDDDNDDDGFDEDDDEEEMEEERKMGYKIEFQRRNSSTPNGGGHNGAPSTFTMVQ